MSRCSRWLTQRTLSAWRRSTRAIVSASPATTATRRSGAKNFDVDFTDTHRSGAGSVSVTAAAPDTGPTGSTSISTTCGSTTEDAGQIGGALRAHRRSGRILCARCDDGRSHQWSERSVGNGVRFQAFIVDRTWLRDQIEQREQIEKALERRILDQHTIARSRISSRSTRSTASSAPLVTVTDGGGNAVGLELGSRERDEQSQLGRLAIEMGAGMQTAQGRIDGGQRTRVGVAGRADRRRLLQSTVSAAREAVATIPV